MKGLLNGPTNKQTYRKAKQSDSADILVVRTLYALISSRMSLHLYFSEVTTAHTVIKDKGMNLGHLMSAQSGHCSSYICKALSSSCTATTVCQAGLTQCHY